MQHDSQERKGKIATRHLVAVAFFVALTAVGAKIEIPLPYVPFTLQTLFVLLAGMLLGSRLGALSQLMYLVIGLIGVPVFARGGGVGYILQPTFGYLVGFVPAAYVVGALVEGKKEIRFFYALVTSLCGLLIVYLFGLTYLWICTNFILGKDLNLMQTVKVGFLLLLPGAAVKAVSSALIGIEVRRRLMNIVRM
ncbi:MAG: biotin transporter BioY [Gemmatimonadota bacterium]|nr:MAG: biotin transporter BioY [Gemmatimonadota bacterium]